MRMIQTLSECACCGMNRRQFLAAGCAACVAAARPLAAEAAPAAARDGKMRIRIIYSLHAVKQPRPDWPNIGFDFAPVMKRINSTLAKECPQFEFVSSMANGAGQAAKILEEDKAAAVDGYLVYQMNCWNRVVQTIAKSGKPVLYADFLYAGSGGFLVYTAGFLRGKTKNVGFVSSSKMEDLVAAVKCFSVVNKGGTTADFVAATKAVLESEPYEVIVAHEGEEGLQKARKEEPDLILLDVIMPVKDGFTAAEQLKKDPKLSKIPVIMLTAFSSMSQETSIPRSRGFTLESEDYIEKPVAPAELLDRVKQQLKR